jgi:hypothetical protein
MSIHLETETSEPLKLIAGIIGICMVAGAIAASTQMGICGVANRTLDADNIIFNYEQFYDVSEQFKARTADIATHTELVATAKSEDDKVELRRLRMEFAALKSSCRSMASEYNADSQKLNRSIFKSNDLPHTLPLSDCE